MALDADSIERLVPELLRAGDITGTETLRLHLERYQFASQHLRSGRLLDIACGVGYGTSLLVESDGRPALAVGVDRSPDAIAYARHRYHHERTHYVIADAMTFASLVPFDTIVSLETIEHLPEPERFLTHLQTLLAPGGILVASVPVTPSVDANPHHLHDFTQRSFRRMGAKRGLTEIAHLHQIQPFPASTVLSRREGRTRDLRRNLPAYYVAHPRSFVRRCWSMLTRGFRNEYLTVAWRRVP